jgi:hypothetical protein
MQRDSSQHYDQVVVPGKSAAGRALTCHLSCVIQKPQVVSAHLCNVFSWVNITEWQYFCKSTHNGKNVIGSFVKKTWTVSSKRKMKSLVVDKNKIQKVVFFSEEVQFTQSTNIYKLHPKCYFLGWGMFSLSTKVKSQNNGYRCTKNPYAVYSFLLYNLKVVVWCAVSVYKNIRPASFKETNYNCFIQLILTPFFTQLTDTQKMCDNPLWKKWKTLLKVKLLLYQEKLHWY